MIINSSNVTMGSSRKSQVISKYSHTETRTLDVPKDKNKKASSLDEFFISDEAKDLLEKDKEKEQQNFNKIYQYENSTDILGESMENPAIQQLKTMLKLLEMLTGKKSNMLDMLDDMYGKSKKGYSNNKILNINSIANTNNSNVWNVEKKTSLFYSETENTVFSTVGQAVTSDGRTISFNVNLEMSRGFQAYYEKTEMYKELKMTDPLVINFGNGKADVLDQTFMFDIDGDGKEDEISMLGENSGFLAYDKNGDGIINDGNELFGTESGNGFKDLSAYDSDNNGWIDETDEIFSKLKIWTKDKDGNDILYTLKDIGIGAIYLGNASTDFNLNNIQTNETNAQIRNTGIYLNENGTTGTIQHVDMAIHNKN